jgi:predicted TIM-barrel fold metal-dependent hydrolase
VGAVACGQMTSAFDGQTALRQDERMVIDSHMHVNYHGYDADALVSEMDGYGIDVAWLLTWYLPPSEDVRGTHGAFSPTSFRPDGTHAGATLPELLAARDRHPTRFVAGYCPCPHEGSAAALFRAAYENHGVRVCGEWSYRMLLDDPRSLELFRAAGALGCPVVLHIDAPYLPDGRGGQTYQEHWYGGDLGALDRALASCPDTTFVGHAPGFWRYISGDAEADPAVYPSGPIAPNGRLFELLERHPNLWADLSAGSGLTALQRDPAHAREFILRYAARLLYGRDAHGNDLRGFLDTLDLPAATLALLLHENAARLVADG